MKNIYKIIALYLFVLLAGSSCQYDMSLTPDSFRPVTFTTEPQLDAQVAGLYAVLATDVTYGQGLWGTFVSTTDEGYRTGISATTQNLPSMYNGTSTDANFANLWRTLYQGIERANIILDVINQPAMSESKRKVYKGDALFLRAYYYYLLVSNFGDVPLKKQTTNDMGTDFNLPRSSTKDVYAYILNDMKAADSLVVDIKLNQTPTMVTKSAVEAVLARVCLSMAGNPVNDVTKYQDALYWANKVINSGIHSLNSTQVPSLDPVKFPGATATPAYSQLFINNMQNTGSITEEIWEAAFLSKSNTSPGYSYAGMGYPLVQQLGALMGVTCTDLSYVAGYSGGTFKVFPHLYNLYAPGDLRRDWAISPYYFKSTNIMTNGVVTGVTTARTNYFTVNITGGGGTGATAVVNSSTGSIASIQLTNGGSGYTSVPTVGIVGASGSGAKAIATIDIVKKVVTGITVQVGGTGYPTAYDHPVGKWRREYEINLPTVREQKFTSCNFPIIRYADVLLMAAEADLMVNKGTPSPAAIECLNEVKRRAFGSTTVGTVMSGVDVATFTLQDIKDERSRELCFEGVRRQDLIRWGDYTKAMQNVLTDNASFAPAALKFAADVSASNFLSNPSKYLLFPIPNNEILNDKSLTQNAGW